MGIRADPGYRVYIFMLDRNASISAQFTVTPGQSVSVTGDSPFAPVWNGPRGVNQRAAPLWGAGSFAVHGGSLVAAVLR